MKKIGILLAAVILLFYLLPLPVSAQGKTDVSSPDHLTGSGMSSLTIDDKNSYDGMDKAYQDGYAPQVRDGTAVIILPLLSDGTIKENRITVSPGLGDPASSPFLFKNYQKTVGLAQNAVNNGKVTQASYLIRFDLPLAPGRRNGVYPVTVNIQAQGADGSPLQQSFTSYVTITDGKNPDSAASAAGPEKQASQPKVMISGYTVTPSPIVAGKEFTVRVTLKNTSKTKPVQNMTVTAACESPNLSLRNASNTIYMERLDEGKTTEISLVYRTDLDTPAQRYNIALAIAYDNPDAVPLSSAGIIPVEISQPLRVELETPQVASAVNAGDTFPITLQVMNLGRSKVYNVRVEMSAPGLIPSGTVFIGNMEPGTAAPGEMDIFAGTKDITESSAGEGKYGLTNGTIKLTYEDSAGQKYSEETAFTTTINKPVLNQSQAEPVEEPAKAGQWWVTIGIAVTVSAGLAAFLIVRNKKRVMRNEDI